MAINRTSLQLARIGHLFVAATFFAAAVALAWKAVDSKLVTPSKLRFEYAALRDFLPIASLLLVSCIALVIVGVIALRRAYAVTLALALSLADSNGDSSSELAIAEARGSGNLMSIGLGIFLLGGVLTLAGVTSGLGRTIPLSFGILGAAICFFCAYLARSPTRIVRVKKPEERQKK